MAYNRELSQFGRFVNVSDGKENFFVSAASTSNAIGIGSTGLPWIGFGTAFPSGKLEVKGHTQLTNLSVSAGSTIGFTSTGDLFISGVTTATGIATFASNVFIDGNLNVKGDITYDEVIGRNIYISGLSTFVGAADFNNGLQVTSGISTFSSDLVVGTGATIGRTGVSTFAEVRLPDNGKILFGDSSDLQIYHSGTESNLVDSGTGVFRIGASQLNITNAALTQTQAKFIENGQVELYHKNVKRFETSLMGAVVSGITTTVDLRVSAAATVSGNLTVGGNLDVTGDITYDEITGRNLNITGISTFEGDVHALPEANVGIGTSVPLNTLQVGAAHSSFTVFERADATLSPVGSGQTILVGIGTTNPQKTLEVHGNSNFEGDLNVNGSLSVNNSATATIGLVIALGG